ncbi:Uncharacterised protein [Mycobacteroides abscessus subsp. abscessus]|nr:Uncharacterised protein [Mycobacteroides abscessus subsp. abscessus]
MCSCTGTPASRNSSAYLAPSSRSGSNCAVPIKAGANPSKFSARAGTSVGPAVAGLVSPRYHLLSAPTVLKSSTGASAFSTMDGSVVSKVVAGYHST